MKEINLTILITLLFNTAGSQEFNFNIEYNSIMESSLNKILAAKMDRSKALDKLLKATMAGNNIDFSFKINREYKRLLDEIESNGKNVKFPTGEWIIDFGNDNLSNIKVLDDGHVKIIDNKFGAMDYQLYHGEFCFLATYSANDIKAERWTVKGDTMTVEHWWAIVDRAVFPISPPNIIGYARKIPRPNF